MACALVMLTVVCGGSSPTTPSPPVSVAPETTPPPATTAVSATLTATNGGQPLSGVTVSAAGLAPLTTDVAGQFVLLSPLSRLSTSVEFTAPSIVPRRLTGHAMGFFHTDSRDDVMFASFNSCNVRVSDRERLHASIAYARPAGNTDPDIDPTGLVTVLPPAPLLR